jgi:type I restriction enzyme S subunit
MIAARVIPSTWKQVVCEDVIDVRDGTHDTPAQVVEGIPLITSKNLKPKGIDFEDVSYISEADYLKIEKRSGVDEGDVLFAMIGTIGNPVIVQKDRKFSIKNVALFKLKGSPVLPAFFKRLLSSEIIQEQLDSALRGGNQKFVSLNVLRNLKIPLPPMTEQRRIAEILDRAEALRDKRGAALAELDSLTQSIFLDLFGDPVTNPRKWLEENLETFFHFKTGKLDSNAAVTSGTYPFFTCSREDYRIDTYAFDCEALLLAGNNASADYSVKHYKGKFNAYQRTYVITLRDEHNSYDYARFVLEQRLAELKRISKGTNTKYLTIELLNRIRIPVPPQELQREFARRVHAVEKLKTSQRASLAELDALFASLQHRAFRGEL